MTTAPTAAQLEAVSAYVEKVRHELYLGHWHVDVMASTPDDSEAMAEINPTYGRYHAQLSFDGAFWAKPAEQQRYTVTHELIHLTHFMVGDAVRTGEYRHQLGKGLYEHLYDQVKIGLEYMVDALTTVVAPHMPLPEIPAAQA